MTSRWKAWKLRATSRVFQFEVVATVIFLLLLFSFWQIQIVNRDHYRERAERNRVKTLPVAAGRGPILDRFGREVAASRSGPSAVISSTPISLESLATIANGLGVDLQDLREHLGRASDFGQSERVVVKEDLAPRDLAFLHARRSEFPEVDLVEAMYRQYPVTGVAVHLVGYVGEASKQELNQREYLLYDYGSEIGKTGIERQYDRWLRGDNGSLRLLVDSFGRTVSTIGRTKPVPGNSLTLTIDLDLQAAAELELEGNKGAVVALDPRNGEVLAMASAPVFDANQFVTGFTSAEWSALHSHPQQAMLNRAIQGVYAMGSVFKPIHGLAGLASGIVDDDFRVTCSGGLSFGGHFFGCHKREGHGTVDLRRAIAVSCDVFFYRLGLQVGVKTLAKFARTTGLGTRTLVDLPGEVPGLVPSTRWKVRRTLRPWQPGETVVLSIGQGALAVTPIQAAHSVGGLAMGGEWHRPHVVSHQERSSMDPDFRPPRPRTAPVRTRHLEALRQSMWDVVNGGGTGASARVSDLEVCGKTGTSQRVSNSLRLKAKREAFEDDAWFVGFAPCSDPRIVVAAVLENGRHSYRAAAIVGNVLKQWARNHPRNPTIERDSNLVSTLHSEI